MRRDALGAVLVALLALGAGLLCLAAFFLVAGFNPVAALGAMVEGAAGSWYAFTSGTLLRAVPLGLIALGFALAYRAGAINIGGEGQFYLGAMAATAVGVWGGGMVGGWGGGVVVVLFAALVAGALWAVVPAWLRLRFGVLEVISTLLLNFVAEALVSYAVQGPLQESQHIYPQSDPIAASARLPLIPGTRLHLGIVLLLVMSAILWFVFARTRVGFELKAAGAGPAAARISGGIKVDRLGAMALLGSGALAGLAGGVEVAGVSYALYPNLSPGYGFTAIAVALLARQSPPAIVAAAILFGGLESGAAAMQRDAGVPAVAVYVAEAVAIIAIILADTLAHRRRMVTA